MNFIRGKESLFYIKKNNVWFPVACLTSSPFSEESEVIDTTTRDNNGWKTSLATNQSYSIQLSGMVVQDDEDSGNNVVSYRELRNMKRSREIIDWKIETLDGYYVDSGRAIITQISCDDPAEGWISFSATLQGYGAPDQSNERVYVLGDDLKTQIYTHDDEKTVINTENI